MIALDDEQLDAVMALAAPLTPAQRGPFLEALASELRAHPGEIGVGAIYRVGGGLQRRFLTFPSGTTLRGPTPRR
jgi:hypothetical protein